MDKKIHIVLAADSNYIIPVTVVLQSIFDNNQEEDINIYLLYLENTLEDKDLKFLANCVQQRKSNFIRLKVKQEQISGFPETRHGKAALLRLCLPDLLPELDKILYLDGDIIVNGNLSPLFSLDITSYYVAAGKDSAGIYNRDYPISLGIASTHFYYNSGIILLNLAAFRKMDLIGEMNKFTHENYQRISSPDQDFLNYICQNKTLYIPPKYNMNYAVEKDILAQIWSKEEIREAKKSPVIIHYIGPVKPWSVLSTHPYRKLWWKYLKKTHFANYRPEDATFRNYIRRYYLLLTKSIERHFSLETKKKIGKLIPHKFKKSLKKSLLKT